MDWSSIPVNPESFPCLICGKRLERANETYEQQPNDGIMCETAGNYGSTVFDSQDGERLAFNICDECMVKAGAQGRVMTYRKYRPVLVSKVVVGREMLKNRPYIPWNADLEPDTEPVHLEPDELDGLPASFQFEMPVAEIRRLTEARESQRSHRKTSHP